MTYEEIVERAKELDIIKYHTFIRMPRGKALEGKYVKLHLRQEGRMSAELTQLLAEVEARVGTKRTFSHNPVKATATFTLYTE